VFQAYRDQLNQVDIRYDLKQNDMEWFFYSGFGSFAPIDGSDVWIIIIGAYTESNLLYPEYELQCLVATKSNYGVFRRVWLIRDGLSPSFWNSLETTWELVVLA
jgi:hypothetical protein